MKPRPLKVTMMSSEDALFVLKNKSKLNQNSNSNIYIKQDLTSCQSKYLAELQTELQSRIDNGEKNLTIRYINKIPRITTRGTTKRDREEQESPRREKGLKTSKPALCGANSSVPE
uniref:Uncharacterized protein LOC114340545 n=1 Tax=Diabrotica virgifera virgifera TaxID=50390 RepID=A0A6P7GTF1_DIAVI